MMRFFNVALAVLCFEIGASAQALKYNVLEETEMTVSGTSTLHDWTSTVNHVTGFVELGDNALENGNVKQGGEILSVHIVVPVDSIISPRGATMDKKTYAALKHEEHPEIIFDLKNSKIESVNGEEFSMKANGDLTVAGKKLPVEFPVEGKVISDEQMSFVGSYKLNMVDYDMEPPSAMFGQIVTGEEVEIKFQLIVKK